MKNFFSVSIIFFINRIFYVLKNLNKNLIIGYKSLLKNVFFEGHNVVYDNCRLSNVKIGYKTYVSSNTRIVNSKIGKYCSIAKDCVIGLATHPVNEFYSSHHFIYKSFSKVNNYEYDEHQYVEIGNDVWIGERAVIFGNIKIGDGCIIASGAVVNKDVEPYSVVAGVPAKFVKYRFNIKTRKYLLDIKWWNWSENEILNKINSFKSE